MSYFIIIHHNDGHDEIKQIIGEWDLQHWENMNIDLEYVVYSSQVVSAHTPIDEGIVYASQVINPHRGESKSLDII